MQGGTCLSIAGGKERVQALRGGIGIWGLGHAGLGRAAEGTHSRAYPHIRVAATKL